MADGRYSPFAKALSDLQTSDLSALKSASEGWYIEYKSEIPNAKAIAKSVCAFANTHGGWLFYGIRQSKDGERTAGEFPGVPTADLPTAMEKLTQAVSANINPAPYFEPKIFSGPDSSIELADGRAVIALHIPQGFNAPYVHSTGRIYRRVADQSDPRPETDRQLLDQLWRRGKEYRKELSNFFENEEEISHAEEENSYMDIYILPTIFHEKQCHSHLTFESFSQLMKQDTFESGGIPFTNCFTMGYGFVARQTVNNDPSNLLFSWRYYFDCVSHITLPLNSKFLQFSREEFMYLNGYDQSGRFLTLCREHGFEKGWVLDIGILFVALLGITTRHKLLADFDQTSPPFYFKAKLTNIWRKIPFIDLDSYCAFINEFGIPFPQKGKTYAPPGVEPESLYRSKEDQQSSLLSAGVLFAHICQALGIPLSALGISETAPDDSVDWLTSLLSLADRARRVQQWRAQHYPR